MTDQEKISKFMSEIGRVFGPIKQETKTMAFELKDNSGSLWVNDRKDADSHPDRTGAIKVGGTEYWLNGWLKKTKDGKPYLSLSVSTLLNIACRRFVTGPIEGEP